jgi:hypothetical protein
MNSLIKKSYMAHSSKILMSSLLMVSLAGCIISTGERTVDIGSSSAAIIERTATLDDGTEAVAGCVAQPSAWASPVVQLSGSAQVGDATVEFSVSPAEYSEGVTYLDSTRKMNGYAWFCYKDDARDYMDNDAVKVTWTLTADSDQAMVFTTIGSEDGIDAIDDVDHLYYMNMASHSIISDDTSGAYLINQAASFSDETFEAESHTLIRFEAGSDLYFTSTQGAALKMQSDGSFQVLQIPAHDSMQYVNNIFIAFNKTSDYDSSTGIDNSIVEIQYSTDLISWSEVIDMSNVGTGVNDVYYDPRELEYIVLNKGSSAGQTKGYYISDDLESWTHTTVGSYQNFHALFADDGRAIMQSTAWGAPMLVRTETGEWTNYEDLPNSENLHYILDFIFSDNQFQVLLKESITEVEGDVSTNFTSIHYGSSENMTNWTWSSIISKTEENVELDTLMALSNGEVAIYGGEDIYLSSDDGASWSQPESVIAALDLNDGVDQTLISFDVSSMMSANGLHYAKVNYEDDTGDFGELYLSTTDFTNYSLVAMANDIELFIFDNSLYLIDAVYNLKWDIYKEETLITTETETETETEKKSGGGAIGYATLFLLIGFIGFRVKRSH